MVTLGPASVVVVTFPFSDLASAKLRPAVVLAEAGRDDWILCQITSNPHSDPDAIKLTDDSFGEGALRVVSFARPTKLFTANVSLVEKRVAILTPDAFATVLKATIQALERNLPD
ncbi:MAG: type II toxin-antitoxin system PemK/MazF family toxin [Anaerolineae bacterium]